MLNARLVRVAAAIAVVALVAACGESNEVGSGVDLNFEDQVNQSLDATTTTSPPTTVAGGGQQQGAIGEATTTTKPPVATTAAPIQHFEVAIRGDRAGTSQFDPPVAVVKAGTLVRWTNTDSKPRSVVADGGQFDSGMLAPGATFVWKASGSGRINYSDGTRPYAVGAVEIR